MSNRYNIHPALYIGGFAVFFSFIFGFPVGTLMGLAIGIGISKKIKICKRVYRWRSYTIYYIWQIADILLYVKTPSVPAGGFFLLMFLL